MDRIPRESAIFEKQNQYRPTLTQNLGYRAELDGLRGISILLVYVHHLYYPLMPGGFFGVDVFFVLSGFLITSLLIQEQERKGSISLKAFYIRRALRLMPALLTLILIIGGFALVFLDTIRRTAIFQGILVALSYASNWFIASGHFTPNNPLGITWSLAIEEQFYLTWPLSLSLALRYKLGRRWFFYILALAIVIIPLHRKVLAVYGANVLRLYYASDTRADTLLIGCLMGLLVSWNLLPRNKGFEISIKSLAVLATVFLAYMVSRASPVDRMLYLYGGYTLVALSIGLVLIVVIVWPPKVVLSLLRFTPLVWIGRISYGLYLWHWPVRLFVYSKYGLPASVGELLIAVVLSLSMTTLSYYFVEKPFLRWKKRFSLK